MLPNVYFTKEITPESLVRVYEALGRDLTGKVAVKISTGEPGGHNFLQPTLIADLVRRVGGTIAECCTAYNGKRRTPEKHWQTFRDHGFTAIAPCDLLDETGEMILPVKNGYHLKVNKVGKKLAEYDSLMILSHFKGHPMGGFGGALKNMSIGLATPEGKIRIHSAGKSKTMLGMALHMGAQDAFLESMTDACSSVMDFMGRENIVYVNVANRLSVDCDCMSHPAEPKMRDLGVFASLDPVALDQACVDAVYHADDPEKEALIRRIESRHGIHTLEAAVGLGLGSREYHLINIEEESTNA